ncbi:MAG TPA: hypothetical protein VM204_08400 [Gaiellaceae bacterium]|nr:hypothetical protein [Gaiellaceae bacterium]
MRRRRLPPGTGRLAVAAIGALALAVGSVATLNGRPGGVTIALGGVVLVAWSMLRGRA